MSSHKFLVMELAANGFGSPEVLMRERADLVIAAYDYLRFKNKYEHQAYLLRERERGRR